MSGAPPPPPPASGLRAQLQRLGRGAGRRPVCPASEPLVGEAAEVGADAWPGPPGDEAELEAREAALTRPVPELLEAMNRAASEVNLLDRQISDAQALCRRLAERCHRLRLAPATAPAGAPLAPRGAAGAAVAAAAASAAVGGLGLVGRRPLAHGPSAGQDHAKRPFLEGAAAQAVRTASERVQELSKAFQVAEDRHAEVKRELRALEVRLGSAGSLSQEEQETLAQATEEVMRCQRERDRLEQEHSRALSAYSSARQVPEVGGSLLRPASPRTRKLRERMDELSCQQRRVEELAARAKAAKETYRLSLVELDRISQRVHCEREQLTSRRPAGAEASGDEVFCDPSPSLRHGQAARPAGRARSCSARPALVRRRDDGCGTARPSSVAPACRRWAPEVAPEPEAGAGLRVAPETVFGDSPFD